MNFSKASSPWYRRLRQVIGRRGSRTIPLAIAALALSAPAIAHAEAAPTAETKGATLFGTTEAILKAAVNPNGLETKDWFEYGTEPLLFVASKSSEGTINGEKTVEFGRLVTGLTPSTKYYFRIVASNSKGTAKGAIHSFTSNGPPVNKAIPVVSPHAPYRAEAASTTNGEWSNSPTSYAYQWKRCSAEGTECTNITGATGSSYTPVAEDVGHALVVGVTASNEFGSGAPALSAATAPTRPEVKMTAYSLPEGYVHGIADGPNERVWFSNEITSGGYNAIGELDPEIPTEKEAIAWYLPEKGVTPWAIAAGPSGENAVWFTYAGEGKIGKLTTSGKFSEYALAGEETYPSSITAGPDGNIWFSQLIPAKIGKITPAGKITEYSLPAKSEAEAVTSGPLNAVWFCDPAHGKIGKITSSGTVTEWSAGAAGIRPERMVVGPDGNLWYTSAYTGKIARFTVIGHNVTEYSVPVGGVPAGITVGADGNLWFADPGLNAIGKLTTTGEMTEYANTAGGHDPSEIVSDVEGDILFTDSDSFEFHGDIVKLTP